MTLLGVNVDHVATLRQARGVSFPDPVEAALLCQKAGADSIVVHLREDRRHIQDDDVIRLKKKMTIKLNLEMSIHPSVVEKALEVIPDTVTLVPEKRQEKTTESGLDVIAQQSELSKLISRFKDKGIGTSSFIDPTIEQIDAAKNCGAEAIELHTGDYANATSKQELNKQLKRIENSLDRGLSKGLAVHVGHGLDYENVTPFVSMTGIAEFNIGFAIISKALFIGLENAVKQMKSLITHAEV